MVSMTALGCGIFFLAAVGLYVVVHWAPDRPVDALQGRWALSPSRFVALDGMRVHVRDVGPADDPTPIVLLHGTGSSLHAWEGWVARLSDRRRVVSLDRPGFGMTGPNPTGDYTMRYYAGFVARLLDLLEIRRCVLVGSSSGGGVAWHVALATPDRVAALVLIAPAGYPRTTPHSLGFRIAQSPWLAAITAHILPRSLVARSLRGTYGDVAKVTPELVERNYELTLRAGNRRALGATLRQGTAHDQSAAIRRVAVPTLILWGDQDTVIPPADAQRFHTAIARSQLVMLPGLGHMPYEEDPATSVAALLAFLASLDAEPRGDPDRPVGE